MYTNIRIGFRRESDDNTVAKRPTQFDGIEQFLYSPVNGEKVSPEQATEDMWIIAEKNTRDDIKIMSLNDFLGLPSYGTPIYVVTNESAYLGAACVLNKDEIRKALSWLGRKFYVIPSSIHEMLIIPYDFGGNALGLAQMIREVNDGVVLPEDQLGDKAYILEV